MYKYGIGNMYYKGEYIQNILLKNPSQTQIIIIINLNNGVYFYHNV